MRIWADDHHRFEPLPLEFTNEGLESIIRVTPPDDGMGPRHPAGKGSRVCLEVNFDPVFVAKLAMREKQVQQSYRPIIGIHKWFARRPGTVFRSLLLAEFNGNEPLERSYWRAHQFHGVIADPFMGGGTPLFEAIRLGFGVIGSDINPMAFWVVRQSLVALDLPTFSSTAAQVAHDVEREIGKFYITQCMFCGGEATVKYFLWVKIARCPLCGTENDLFPGYLIADAVRHPRHVVVCRFCGALNEYDQRPSATRPAPCGECGRPVQIEGPARRGRLRCRMCAAEFAFSSHRLGCLPRHRLFALEYHCANCKPGRSGRFFKRPDVSDLERVRQAEVLFAAIEPTLPIPNDEIPRGDETDRLLRWGYRRYRDLFNTRQLLGLGLLLQRIRKEEDRAIRHALLTVFSDFLRYQNMLCRYDTYALKCQDIFSVHGFPVGLIQCENNLIGIPRVGSGSFRHFVEKYRRAKEYGQRPFETRQINSRKQKVPVHGECILATFVNDIPQGSHEAWLHAAPATEVSLAPGSLDGVFTDPPYFDNLQYAELMDFCYVWLRKALAEDVPAFASHTTRTSGELTGNTTMQRGMEQFTVGLARVFAHYAAALKSGAPFVFTYHHNDPAAYVPVVVAVLDAGLDCTATLPVPAEMEASLHINGNDSSILDSVFVCRRHAQYLDERSVHEAVEQDAEAMVQAGVRVSDSDRRCLWAGHVARRAINRLRDCWDTSMSISEKMHVAAVTIIDIAAESGYKSLARNGRKGRSIA